MKKGRPNIKNTTKIRLQIKNNNIKKKILILEKTNFLNEYYLNVTQTQRNWHYKNNIYEIVKCICGNPAVFKNKRYKNCTVQCRAISQNIKTKKTCNDRYGVDSPLQFKKFKDKAKKTCNDRYGVDNPFQSEEIKSKIKKAINDNYGVDNPFQSEEIKLKIKKTINDRYGVDNYLLSDDYKNKMIQKFGYPHPSQNSEFFEKKSHNTFIKKDYILPSSKIIKLQGYEPYALDILLIKYNEDDILYSISDICKYTNIIRYKHNNSIHRYYPDFLIKSENIIIEVKSTWTYNLHKDINILKKNECLKLGFNFEFMIFDNKVLNKHERFYP